VEKEGCSLSPSYSNIMIKTPLMGIVAGLKTPIVLGPMANAAGGSLAGQVSKAGGLGFLGAGYYTSKTLQSEIQKAHSILGIESIPKGTGNRVQLGVGFLAWRLTLANKGKPPTLGASDLEPDSPALELIDVALKSKPIAIWLSFGDEEEMIGWSNIVRQREAALNGMGRATYGKGLKVFIGVGDEVQAKTAVEDCGADVVILQGSEAGGHGMGSSPPLSAALPLLVSRLPSFKPSNPSGVKPALLGAGGIMTGSQLAAVLSQGADGAVLGTRMLFTPEATYTDAQKQMLQEADTASTKRTMAFDEARNTLGWPQGVDGRGIINDTVHDYENGVGEGAESRQKRYKEAESKGDKTRLLTWAGTGVGLCQDIKPAADVVAEVTAEAIESIKRLHSFV
jgi:nitronate monooxygenase